MRKSLLLLLAVLIALPTANAVAQPAPTLNVAIIKCFENNSIGGDISVFKTDATFTLPDTCAAGATSCAACLRDLANHFQCRGGTVFTSNVETTQPTISGTAGTSINKYVLACGPAVP